MKINRKLMALMMACIMGGTVVTGCGQKVNDQPVTEQETPNASDNVNVENQNQIENNTQSENNAQGENYGEQDPTVAQETLFVITDGIETVASSEMPEEMLVDAYGIDLSLLESYSVQMPMMNVHAEEIAVFEVKDEKDIDAVKEGIAKRQKALEEQWSSYLPEQYELVKASKTVVKGNLVLYVVSAQADKIVSNFEA